MRDEVNEPLGLASGPTAVSAGGRSRELRRAVAGAAVFATVIGFFANARHETPSDGSSFAAATVEISPAPAAPPPPGASDAAADAVLPAIASADQVEAASGVKVTRSGGAGAPGGIVIDVAQALGITLEAAPDERLVETSRYGLLPRVGADGAKAFDVYSRPILTSPKLKAGAPRVALMVGGLGLNAEGTEGAIAKLPGAVTLGFAPYGAAVDRQAADARAAGHETVLEAPMEGFSAPPGDPNPHTLTTAASGADNLDSLHWLMGRFAGYVAVANHLGGKFTAARPAISLVMSEIAARGLGYLDDGSSPQSLAPDVALALAMPSARADVVIDANPSPAPFDAALERLVDLARERGAAIGVASASPGSVDRLARWTSALETKGVALVPLSALMSEAPTPSAHKALK
jgi:polysaccharide deacetylase 2 family uncharacterized protein YibQ